MRLGEMYDVSSLASTRIALDAVEAVRRLTEFTSPTSDFVAAMTRMRATAIDMKAQLPVMPIRRICERCEAKDARIAELEQEVAEYIDMLPVIEEPSGA